VLTFKKAHETFSYDPVEGVLTWKIKPNPKICIGTKVGGYTGRGYLGFGFQNKKMYVHRVVWLMAHGSWPVQIDHVDHDKTNNRLENLRSVTASLNNKNRPLNLNNKSGMPGVCWNKANETWVIRIGTRYLCCKKDKFEACCERKKAEIKYNYHVNTGKVQIPDGEKKTKE
tara:strand:+ start:290 stop:802 length:513 start_codon:yes stop_codon:yes gene_type:complete